MKKLIYLYSILAFVLIFASCDNFEQISNNEQSKDANLIENQFIIVLKADKNSDVINSALDIQSTIKKFISDYNLPKADILAIYDKALFGFAAKIKADILERIKLDPRVDFIEQDKWVHLDPVEVIEHKNPQDEVLTQTTPWGITAVGGYADASNITRRVWILDTGIDLSHPDLNVNTNLSRSFVTTGQDRNNANDLNGHGTHVAGIIGAKNNTIGVVGVAAGATLVAVKVLDRNGSGTISQIVNGINYVINNGSSGDVVNLSLGGGASTTLDNAVSNCASYGFYIAIAAGNSSANAGNYSPARVNGARIYTISAHNSSDYFASFSNYGNPPIDYCAPGVSIYSTYRNRQYATMSGTSMAAPHVAGILLVNNGTIYTRGYVNNDPDGTRDPLASRTQ